MGIQINGNTDNIGATDGSLSIEDIQEVNATGVITATNFKTGVSNLHSVGLTLTGGQVDVGSNIKIGTAGVITATSFVGSGANLTGITGTTINNNADNRIITGSGTANTLEGEANLTFNGGATGDAQLTVHAEQNDSGADSELILETSNDFATSAVMFKDSTAEAGSIAYNHGDNYIKLSTNGTNGGTERLRIDSSGKIIIPIGTTTRIGVADRTSGTGAGGSLLVTAGAARGSGQTTGDLILASGRGNNSASAGTIRFGYNDGSDGTNLDQEWLRITSGGVVNIGANASSNPFTYLRFGASQYGAADIRPIDEGSHKVGLAFYVDGTQDTTINPTEKMRIRSDGHVKLQQGLTALSGGGVIVCAAKSSSGTANQSNYKVDFVVPMADLGPKQEYEDIQSQFSSGQTGKDWAHNRGGSGILIATVQNDYYWGFRTKIYHITTYGNNSNNVTQLNLLHNYSAAGHGSNSASVDLTVQSHDGKTPTLRGTFSGDYWNSNILTVTYIGSAVASTGSIRQLTTFDSKLTGQDPTWK